MLYLIDASVYVFRAYYSMPPDMLDREGNAAHALFGFARFLGDLIERAKPRYLAVAFDESLETSFRNRIDPAYKANREPAPADLKLQFGRCREFCEHLGVAHFGSGEYEADDIIGTLHARFRREGLPATLVTRDKDLAWMTAQAAGFDIVLKERADLAMVAVQGPNARAKVLSLLSSEGAAAAAALGKFVACDADGLFIARTGYTGEDGFEIMVPEDRAIAFWQSLAAAGVRPCGLGARDTLRLEAGMSLYGQDMDETVSPYEAGLAWTVTLDDGRDFIGRPVLEKQLAEGSARQMIGLVMDEKGVLRHGQAVFSAAGGGEILSGTFSPTLSKGIALARVPAGEVGAVEVDIRGRRHPLRVVKYPFVRDGKPQAGV